MKSVLGTFKDFLVTAFAWFLMGVWLGVAALIPIVGIVWSIKTIVQFIGG